MKVLVGRATQEVTRLVLRSACDPPLLVAGGTVVDASGVRPHHDILVVGDRIASVEPGIRLQEGSVLNATGMLVMPGLVDTWANLDSGVPVRSIFDPASLLLDLLRRGTTTAHAVGIPEETGFALRQGVAEGLIHGPRLLFAGSPPASGDSPDALLRALRRAVGRGADVLVVSSAGSRGEVHLAREVAADLRRPLMILDAGVDSIGSNTTGGGADLVDAAIGEGAAIDTAVAAATLEPATVLGLADRIGSITRGLLAEMVIVETPADPAGKLFSQPPQVVVRADPAAPWADRSD